MGDGVRLSYCLRETGLVLVWISSTYKAVPGRQAARERQDSTRAAVRVSFAPNRKGIFGIVKSLAFLARLYQTIFVAILALTSCASSNTSTAPLTLDEVLALHAEARGGSHTLEHIHSRGLRLQDSEPMGGVTGLYRASREGMPRVDTFSSSTRVLAGSIGNDGTWTMNADGKVTDASAAGQDALHRGLIGNLYALHERANVGYSLEFDGLKLHEGAMRYVIEERTETGLVKSYYLDPATGKQIESVAATHRLMNALVDPARFSRPTDTIKGAE